MSRYRILSAQKHQARSLCRSGRRWGLSRWAQGGRSRQFLTFSRLCLKSDFLSLNYIETSRTLAGHTKTRAKGQRGRPPPENLRSSTPMHRSPPLTNTFTATLNTLWMCAYLDFKPESRVRGLVYPDGATATIPSAATALSLPNSFYHPSNARLLPTLHVLGYLSPNRRILWPPFP